ncbi:hypothetical protein HO133_008363 [Letharia lupina]|uniref:SWR1-complex protein 3 domain-containing protein n=1 Tax=Letharia lupina TaxID=560253 RepID=A0A8H6CNT3_9LECA|nr:uncharacterized protein HO133_008363 [Letharia lupina]KAF6226922.1 hypothetical protein HO133_008363 [Letharia lupina]
MDKRRLSTRNRGEPPMKKRALTPPAPPRAPPAPSAPPQPTDPKEEGLPFRLKDSHLLPTLPEPQDANLSIQEYQTISESGVLAASIELSRQKWFKEGVFDRYWEKPTKKKPMFEAPNPPKETMSKLGVCSLIVEPHVFEITLYTVKDNPMAYTPIQPPPLSSPQYNPFATAATYPPYNYNTAPAPPKYHGQQQGLSSQTTLPPFHEGFAQFGPQGPPPINHAPLPAPAPVSAPEPPNLSKARSTSQQGGSQDQNGEPKQDPVIQMLATRAASDHGLKTLMKVVASGQASPTQLKDFQDHIDELNTILKTQPNPSEPLQDDNRPQPPPRGVQEYVSRVSVPTSTPDSSWSQVPSVAPYSNPYAQVPSIKTEPSSKTQPFTAPSASSKSAYTVHKPEINSIVFDFGGTGDRFSFPRFSILEYLYGGTQVIVSFLVIKRGSTAKSGKYKDTKNYYQPVTMRLSTSHPRILEPLAKIVAPPDEVRRYMDSVFDKMTPADTIFLATRLPRAQDADGPQKPEIAPQLDPQVIRPVYSPPNSIMPLAA